jgi:predicted hotdog family 3-hydroxylacyl-ACP dehydratase
MNHDAICARLPHAGSMCLLDRLETWDADSIRCRAVSHRDPHNPLRSAGHLHAVCGVEYAAQAMALHGSLLGAADAAPAIGYLASVRDLKLNVEDLAGVPDELSIQARRLSGDATGFIYQFEVEAGGRTLLSGRLAARLLAAGEAA